MWVGLLLRVRALPPAGAVSEAAKRPAGCGRRAGPLGAGSGIRTETRESPRQALSRQRPPAFVMVLSAASLLTAR